jgi:hypothetical protein
MVTNYPQQLAASSNVSSEATASNGGFVGRIISRLGQTFCGLRGHDAILHYEGNRVMMRCTSCGHDTPGWETAERAPQRRYDGDARRHLLDSTPPKLVLRKTA